MKQSSTFVVLLLTIAMLQSLACKADGPAWTGIGDALTQPANPEPSKSQPAKPPPKGAAKTATPSARSSVSPGQPHFNLQADAKNEDKAKLAPAPAPDPATKDVDFGPYMASLQRAIKRHWFPPKGLEDKRVVAIFKIHRGGEISGLRLDNTCGFPLADEAGLKAVRDAAPFRQLPDGAPSDVDIQFTFDWNVFSGSGHGVFRQF